jgi:phosphinothricin acetyltransferase
MSAAEFRAARPTDLQDVAAIYNEGIADRVATFETEPRATADLEPWLVGAGPFLVAELDGAVAGFARVGDYSDRCVYSGVGEHAVYVARSSRGTGLGVQLLRELAAAAEAAGFYKLTTRVFTDNEASLAAHYRAGFERIGVQRRHGRLDGEWKDCVLIEILLGEAKESDS